MINCLIREHYKLDWCTYGGGRFSNVVTTEVYFKEGESEMPSTKLSQYVKLIKKGVISEKAGERQAKLFEASLKINDLPKWV